METWGGMQVRLECPMASCAPSEAQHCLYPLQEWVGKRIGKQLGPSGCLITQVKPADCRDLVDLRGLRLRLTAWGCLPLHR